MKRFVYILLLIVVGTAAAHAKVWRVNNRPGADPDFTDLPAAVTAAAAGDTIHVEPSATAYSSFTISKQLVFIGNGYLLGNAPTDNAGLQADTLESRIGGYISFSGTGAGSKLVGLVIANYMSPTVSTGTLNANLTFEKCKFEGSVVSLSTALTVNALTFRKCFFVFGLYGINSPVNNFVVENSIIHNPVNSGVAYVEIELPSGLGNVFRNNVVNVFGPVKLYNFYVANNVFLTTSSTANSFTSSNVKNNLFSISAASQPLPTGATGNLFGQTSAAIFTLSGSADARWQLKPGSPALGFGVTVGTVVSPDAGAFGATDPYKLSGIPSIPTIYNLTAPASIPQGQATMNVTISTRNNN